MNALLAQTYGNWRAVILDDGAAARQVVTDLGDERILYSPNRERLGPDLNIIRAFSRQPMAGGEFFYVLEDDNLIVPTFIEENLGWLSTHDVGLIINNQWVEVPQSDPEVVAPVHDNRTTIDCFTAGVWSADDFKVALLWRMPISNGSIFWRRDCHSVFTVEDRYDPALHEWLRAYRIADAVYFNDMPNAFWHPTPEDPPRSLFSGMPVFLMRERTVLAMRRNILAGLRVAARSRSCCRNDTGGRWPFGKKVSSRRSAVAGASGLSRRRRVALLGKALVLRSIVRAAPL